jgi:hypothetical protein
MPSSNTSGGPTPGVGSIRDARNGVYNILKELGPVAQAAIPINGINFGTDIGGGSIGVNLSNGNTKNIGWSKFGNIGNIPMNNDPSSRLNILNELGQNKSQFK